VELISYVLTIFFWNSFLCGEYFNQINMLHLTFSETAVNYGAIILNLYTIHHKKCTKIPTEDTYEAVVMLPP
jgi:hypothetical protein